MTALLSGPPHHAPRAIIVGVFRPSEWWWSDTPDREPSEGHSSCLTWLLLVLVPSSLFVSRLLIGRTTQGVWFLSLLVRHWSRQILVQNSATRGL